MKVLGHDEYGYTLTRADGSYDLLVNGGSDLVLRFKKPGYLEAQRSCTLPINDYLTEDDVALIGKNRVVHVVPLTPGTMVHSKETSDRNGDRELWALFQDSTTAKIAKAAGDTASLPLLHLHLTEYTVGSDGLPAMPGMLPPSSAYTYCVDFSVDEADSIGQIAHPELPAPDVLFSKPVTLYLRNFLNLAVGTAMPYGYYDRRAGRWVAGKDGWVVQVCTDSAGHVTLDTNGDGHPDGATRLDSLQVSSSELQTIAATFTPGTVLWRMTADRFSNADFNLARAFAASPRSVPPVARPLTPHGCLDKGSIIGCEDRILGERVDVAGTPYQLNYWSFRAPGDAVMRTVHIPVVGTSAPAGLQRVIVQLAIAGKLYTHVVNAPTASTPPVAFTWDGLDAYQRPVPGTTVGTVNLGYDYSVVVAAGSGGQSLGDPAASGMNLGDATNDRQVGLTLWTHQIVPLGAPSTTADGLGGWTLNVHHTFDPVGLGTLYMGDGTVVPQKGTMLYQYSWIQAPFNCQTNEPGRIDSMTTSAQRLAFGPSGTLYIADACRHSIFRVDRSGNVLRVAGNGQAGRVNPDTGPATGTPLPATIYGLAASADGSVYFAASTAANDPESWIVCSVTPDGMIHKIIGGKAGSLHGGGDGLTASQAWTGEIRSLALGPDGSLFLGEAGWEPADYRVRRIGPNGVITTYAGSGGSGSSEASGRATAIPLALPSSLVADPDGSLYIGQEGWDYGCPGVHVIQVTPDGNRQPYISTGGFNAKDVRDMARAADGTLYVLSGDGCGGPTILKRTPDGTLQYEAGLGGQVPTAAHPVPALYAPVSSYSAIACDANGHYVYGGNCFLWRTGAPDQTVRMVPSEDGSEIYAFATLGDSANRHLYTRDALTGAVKYRFGYDDEGRLTSVRDVSGLTTTIVRASNGTPQAILGPYGQTTALACDGSTSLPPGGHLSSITAPGNEVTQTAAGADGLLTSFTDPLGNVHSFSWASDGRLQNDAAPASTGVNEALSAPAYDSTCRTVTVTTAEGRGSSYTVCNQWDGIQRRTISRLGGLTWVTSDSVNARRKLLSPDGSSVSDSLLWDPRLGETVPVLNLRREALPSGITRTTAVTRTIDANFDPPSQKHGTWAEDISLNERAPYHVSFNLDTMLVRTTSPVGRYTTASVDSAGRPLTITIPGLATTNCTYDGSGRVSSVSQGGRGLTFGYDPLGQLATVRDTLRRLWSTSYSNGRPSQIRYPDGRTLSLSLDANGNLTSLTPPGQPPHRFVYDGLDEMTQYTWPSAGTSDSITTYTYNHDRQLTLRRRPGNDSLAMAYDATSGRLKSVAVQTGVFPVYYKAAGQVDSVGSPYGVTVQFGYDGPVMTSQTWSGVVQGSVSSTLDRDFRTSSEQVNGGNTVSYGYDADGFITQAGAMTIFRRTDNGLISGDSLGYVTAADIYSSNGDLLDRLVTHGGSALYEVTYTRDATGRVTGITEIVGGTTTTTSASYGSPDSGLVTKVLRNGVTEWYRYDANGNRLATASDTATATYDAQDRLLRYGRKTYTYALCGDLAVIDDPWTSTSVIYDGLGNLLGVYRDSTGGGGGGGGGHDPGRNAPSGGQTVTSVAYASDALGRRVQRSENGLVRRQWLYGKELGPVAELDSTGALVARYVYGTSAVVPDYIVKNGTTYRIITDQLGSVRLVVDAGTGNVAQRITYDAFGKVLEDTNPGFQCFGFAGGLWDTTTHLVRFGARDYDPSVGRWTAKDPAGLEASDYNAYSYCSNDPFNMRDDDGHSPAAVAGSIRELAEELESLGPWGDAAAAALLLAAAGYEGYEAFFSEAQDPNAPSGGAEHTAGARRSTKGRHEDGLAQKQQSRGGEKADECRRPPRRRPVGWKGPWPRKK